MTNHPRVLIENMDDNGTINWRCTLDMTIPYKALLEKRLALLNAWVNETPSLEAATALINEAGVVCQERDVQAVVFGAKGMIPSTIASLEGRNTNRPSSYTGSLVRKDGSPFFVDQYGNQFVRGVVVDGNYPRKPAVKLFTKIRQCIETNLNLPQYVRHQVGSGDHTYDRDANGNPR